MALLCPQHRNRGSWSKRTCIRVLGNIEDSADDTVYFVGVISISIRRISPTLAKNRIMTADSSGPATTQTGSSLGQHDLLVPPKVERLDKRGFPAIPFAISLPTSTLQGWDDPTPKGDSVALLGDRGIVGSVVIVGAKSAMIWVGWGQLELSPGGASNVVAASSENDTYGFGKGR
jgi:hypothetical protein